MADEFNPMGREYSRAEIAAGARVGVARWDRVFDPFPTVRTVPSGQMIGGGLYSPETVRRMADDWTLVADAMEREVTKGEHDD